ncbi:NAD(P)H-binding protein [Streptomyces sp. AK02-01A]|uniref:NAD(P)H-binding protein n=1 Tax=Streptomyces sp. AK02-01A TaxID=3028648 RepID=UPI0029BAC398|nr:NAD(P)H-binding protein [Streptomyces sp. AK02-01A]MDX3852336.1 NAD(P)H-binding protein [Streptomyces sp. AK02-01A]
MSTTSPILVTGAAGNVGAVGRTVVQLLRERDLPVRAMVRTEDDRARALRKTGAEVVVGDLTRPPDVAAALDGCRRIYFGMSVSSSYLEVAVSLTALARETPGLEALVNISQMTVSQMSSTSTDESRQQRTHWMAEQVLNWSGLPVVHVRPTVFVENPLFTTIAADSIVRDGTLRLPFGAARTSPVAAQDVARVMATILAEPAGHIGNVYELTGPFSLDMNEMAEEYSAALGRPVTYVDVPYAEWSERIRTALPIPSHVVDHIVTMGRLHAQNRYDRLSDDVRRITGREPLRMRDALRPYVADFRAPTG